ncbi:MAG: BrnT family toxin [Chloroflexia bacterium]|nr:BrnT family toxin [Chloroflexia bacterium]
MEFEWDPAKDALNIEKHGIAFEDAEDVFADPERLAEDSTKPEFGEERRRAIGRLGPNVVTVVFTDRNGRRRIISARRADKHERARYDERSETPT